MDIQTVSLLSTSCQIILHPAHEWLDKTQLYQRLPITELTNYFQLWRSDTKRNSSNKINRPLTLLLLFFQYNFLWVYWPFEDVPRTLWKAKAHHNSKKLFSIVSQMNPIRIYFNISLPSSSRLFQVFSFLRNFQTSGTHSCSRPCVPHTLSFSCPLIWSSYECLECTTIYYVLHYAYRLSPHIS